MNLLCFFVKCKEVTDKESIRIIAASAEAAGALVWHYDEDFDRIAEITGQARQATQWVAPRGSL